MTDRLAGVCTCSADITVGIDDRGCEVHEYRGYFPPKKTKTNRRKPMTIEEANVAQVQANITKTEAETELTKAHARLMNAQADEMERLTDRTAGAVSR